MTNFTRLKNAINKITTHFLIRSIAFWLIVFFVFRLLFIITNLSSFTNGIIETLPAFFYGLRLDLSMSAYLCAIPFLLWYLYGFFSKSFIKISITIINKVLIVPVIFICLMNIGNYANWGTVINKRVLLYFEHPAEITHFMSTWQLVLTPLAVLLFILIAYFFYNRFVKKVIETNQNKIKHTLNVLFIPVLVILIRGGLQLIPINESAAYYSNINANNHAAVNPVYYFSHSISEYFYVNEKYQFFSNNECEKLIDELMVETNNDSLTLTNVQNPNLIIIILESWTADILEQISGEKNITPFTKKLIDESLFFERCYGSGYRTDQGLVSILAGYPSQPDNSIIAYPSKTEKLPSLCKHLKEINYNSSFFYGGDLEFANMKSFILQQGFEHLSDQNNYSAKDQNSKWGAHDNLVLQSQLDYINTLKNPFFSVILTLSTHEPFEIPTKPFFEHTTTENKFKNAARFTDDCLKDYFTKAKQTDWYKNTLILLVADHGHHLPLNRNLDQPESKRITCLLTGGALSNNMKGERYNSVINQHDIIKILAPYFGYDEKNYPFANNPFKSKHHFAYYSNENILAFVTDTSQCLYEIQTKKTDGNTITAQYAKAYLQWLYNDFVNQK